MLPQNRWLCLALMFYGIRLGRPPPTTCWEKYFPTAVLWTIHRSSAHAECLVRRCLLLEARFATPKGGTLPLQLTSNLHWENGRPFSEPGRPHSTLVLRSRRFGVE